MPKVLDRSSVLFSIAEEKLGYEFGQPERVGKDSLSVVLPILRHSPTPRIYTTFPETKKLKVVDSGAIDTMNATNEDELTVFLRSGTIFSGATQERASLRSTIIVPGATAGIKVRCIHQTRGIQRGSKVSNGGIVPLVFDQANYSKGFTAADQQTYWNNAVKTVNFMRNATGTAPEDRITNGPEPLRSAYSKLKSRRAHSTPMGALRSQALWQVTPTFTTGGMYDRHNHDHVGPMEDEPIIGEAWNAAAAAFATSLGGGGSDNLASHFADFAKNFDDVLSKVNLVEDQVGLALITVDGVQTVEVFDAHQSWTALHKDAVKRLGPNMAGKDDASVFEYKPEKARDAVRKVLAMPFKENLIHEHKPSNGEPAYSVLGLTADGWTGEVVELDGKVIHMMLLKTTA